MTHGNTKIKFSDAKQARDTYTTTRTSKENCTERMQPSGTIRYAGDQYLPYKHSVPALIRRCEDLPATM
jgi:hypothetical protein